MGLKLFRTKAAVLPAWWGYFSTNRSSAGSAYPVARPVAARASPASSSTTRRM